MDFVNKYKVKPSEKVKLSKWSTDDGPSSQKEHLLGKMEKNVEKLSRLQYLLYAESRRSVLIILQAMDAGGKDGTVKHVMGPLNPQSCKVSSFKAPTDEELAHDFLWRVHKEVPRNGEIRVFNRSQYEDVLVVRVHNLVARSVWSKRYEQINNFEKLLAENNVHILKFYLHISKGEQLKRFRKRLDDSTKYWKASPSDFEERKYWSDYTRAFEEALSRTSTHYAPWFIIPSDKKWYRNCVISDIIVSELSKLKMKFPQPAADIEVIKKQFDEDGKL